MPNVSIKSAGGPINMAPFKNKNKKLWAHPWSN
jgi:hypothetical protein